MQLATKPKIRSPLSYWGGKSRLAERIIKKIPKDHLTYCEPFSGAAWVFFGKEPSKAEILNDRDGELVNFFRIIQNHLEEFIRHFKYVIVSRDIFLLEQSKDPKTLTDIQRAVRYYYLQRLAFSGMTINRHFASSVYTPVHLNVMNLEESLLKVHSRLHRVTIENLDACEFIKRYDRPTTFFYIDPPYWKVQGYAVPWGKKDFDRLAETLKTVRGKFLLSINDTPETRQLFSDFKQQKISTTYSGGDARKSKDTRTKKREELLIRNF